jgi:hypothetical protein
MSRRLSKVLSHIEKIDFDVTPSKNRTRAVALKYEITEAEYLAMATMQAGGCAICGRKSIGGKSQRIKYLSVDHCHSTGQVRGLLCHSCNTGLGMFGDSPERMRLAIAYLERRGPRSTVKKRGGGGGQGP